MKRKRTTKESNEKTLSKKIESEKNAERERKRVKSLKLAFDRLQKCLPSVPPDTKLSKRDILILAAHRISELTKILADGEQSYATNDVNAENCLRHYHPIKKWPMRSRLYDMTPASIPQPSQSPSDVNRDEESSLNSSFYSPRLYDELDAIDFCAYDSLAPFALSLTAFERS
ncbi:Helix-loop-helix DNA-binding domain containing protein 2-like protein [Leptotrombidium deliense]|uniref:Helix-loop-helix DNA-binding domain containing protein 2-like protein n=1 Tax=Leptotrombidium deliense TaxID=299467 RepID=A0A443STA3_9ACAR|nr:Helix-loop-helix DNA-binding domain containing protein 2-like protein [Leptotrombidium deliense]